MKAKNQVPVYTKSYSNVQCCIKDQFLRNILKKKERDKKKCFNNIYTYAFWLKITGTNCTSFLQHLLSLYIYTLPCQYQSDCLDTASNCDVLNRAPWAS